MDRIDAANFQTAGQPGITPLSKPSLLGRTYAPVTPASGAPSVRREALQQEGTLARIGPATDTFESSATAPSPGAVKSASKAASLVAARVPGGIDFTEPAGGAGAMSQSASQTVPLYRHPADRNTVATAVHAGRILDVNG
jgi:hypothetical protein